MVSRSRWLAGGVAALFCLGLLRGAVAFRGILWEKWQRWRYPPPPPIDNPLGREILQERRNQWARQVSQEHGRIKAAMASAKGRGARVSLLEPRLERALDVARQGSYREALMLLHLIEMQIPKAREPVIGVGDGAERVSSEPIPAVVQRKVRRQRRHSSRAPTRTSK